MKMPEYSLKKGVSLSNGILSDPTEFPAGTLIFPFWNEQNLPKHIKNMLSSLVKAPAGDRYVMCLIGRTWVPVLDKDIRRNG